MSASSSSGPEQRRHVRFPPPGWIVTVTLPRTWLGLAGGKSFDAQLANLSESGLGFVSPQELLKGASIRVRIEEPKSKEVVEAAAAVVRVTPPPPVAATWVIAAQFVDMPREHALRIAKWRAQYAGA